jgi:hypothetical protein
MTHDTRKADALDAVGQLVMFFLVLGLLTCAAWAFLESYERGTLPADADFLRDMARLAVGLWPL